MQPDAQRLERSLAGSVNDPRPARGGSAAAAFAGSADAGRLRADGRLAVRPAEPPLQPAQQAPVIEVTIGRIEVRAVRAPESRRAPARPAAAAPKLSLEEYLARAPR
jgi:hypothetical protein